MSCSGPCCVFYRTTFGFHLRAVGEMPDAAASAGIPVRRVQSAGLALSGALAGLAGRERLAEQGMDPESSGWGRLENVLWCIAHHGPVTPEYRRRHKEVVALGGFRLLNSHLFFTKADMVPFLSGQRGPRGLSPRARPLSCQS
jgi:hypothetical protein